MCNSRIANEGCGVMQLKPQDVVLAFVLALDGARFSRSYQGLADFLGMSASEIHAGVRRLKLSALWSNESLEGRVDTKRLGNFCIYGLPVWLPGKIGQPTIGFATGESSECLSKQLTGGEHTLVWPSPSGNVRGLEFPPIHGSCAQLAKLSTASAEVLKVVDGLRSGSARVRRVSESELRKVFAERRMK